MDTLRVRSFVRRALSGNAACLVLVALAFSFSSSALLAQSVPGVTLLPGFSAEYFYRDVPRPDGITARGDGTLLFVNEASPEGVLIARKGHTFDAADAFSTLGPPFVNPDDMLLHPDGTVYVVDGQAQTLFKIPAGGGTPIAFVTSSTIGVTNSFNPFGIALAPATFTGPNVNPGDIIVADNAFSNQNRAVWAVNPATGAARAIAQGNMFADGPVQVVFSLDGRLFVFENYWVPGKGRIVVLGADGTVTPFLTDIPGVGNLVVHPATGHLYFCSLGDIWRISPNAPSPSNFPGSAKLFASGLQQTQDIVFSQDGSTLYVSMVATVPGDIIAISESLMPGTRSVLFAGATQNVRMLNSPQVSTALTVEAWVYPMMMAEGDAVILRRFTENLADPFLTYSLHLHRNSSSELPTAVFSISSGIPGSVTSVNSNQTKIPFFKWTHIAATFDGSSMKVYVDGGLANQTPATLTIPSGGEIRLGLSIAPLTNSSFVGFIDEVRHWNIVRAQSKIQGAMGGLLSPGFMPGLIGYWKFEEDPSATALVDFSPEGNTGQYRAGAHTEQFCPFDPAGTVALSVSPLALDVGIMEEGETAQRQVTISNAGSSALVGYFAPQGGIKINAPAYIVAAGQQASKTLSITPTSHGVISASVAPMSNALGTPTQISISGTALQLQKFDLNNVSVYLARDGRIGRSPTVASGFEWPKGSGKSPIYQAGLMVSAQVGADIRTAGAYYTSEYQAGPVVGGSAPNPSNNAYRVYKISGGDFSASNPDFGQWPTSWGAPANNDGTPQLLGGQTLFAVYNDMNTVPHMQGNGFRTQPLGCEVQQTVYGFTNTNSLKNTIFVRYRLVNRSGSTWTNAYASFWSDPDIGDARDDLAGCDPGRDLGYAYNGSSIDATYSSTPPAVGYAYLEGTTGGKPMSAFSYFASGALPQMSDPTTGVQVYNYARGLTRDGNPITDPTVASSTVYPISGDPVTGTGWVDQNPSDRRVVINSGSFNLAPDESKEVVFAIVIGQGTGNLNSVAVMKNSVDEIRSSYPNFSVFSSPTQLALKSYLQTPSTEEHMFRGITTNRAGTLVYICDSQTDVVYVYRSDQSNVPIGSFGDPSWQVSMLGPYGIGTSEDDMLYIAVANDVSGHSLWRCNSDGTGLVRLCGLPDFPRDLHVVGGGANTVIYVSGSSGNVIRWTPSGGASILYNTLISQNQQDVVPNASQSALYVSSWTRVLGPANSPYDSPVTKWDYSGNMDMQFSTSYVPAGNVPGISLDNSGNALYLLHIGIYAGFPGDAHIYKVDALTGAQISSVTLGPGGTLAGGGIHVSRSGEIYFSRTFGSVNGHMMSVWGKVVDPSMVIPPEFQAPAGYVTETYATNINKPVGLALDRNHKLLVAESGSGKIYRYESKTNRTLVAQGFGQPIDIVVVGDVVVGDLLYVSDYDRGGIYQINLSGALPVDASGLAPVVGSLNGPTFLQVGPGGYLFASVKGGTSSDKVIRIALPSGPATDFLNFGASTDADPQGIVFSPAGDMYVCAQLLATVPKVPFDILTPPPIAASSLPLSLEGLDSPAGIALGSEDRLYVATRDNILLSKRDSKAWSPFITGLGGGLLNNVEYAGNGELYVADYAGGRIIRVALPRSQMAPPLQFPIVYKTNEVGHPDITDGSAFTAIRNGFQHWTGLSTCMASFQDGGMTSSRFASMTDGVNLVTFTDDQFPFPPGVLAVVAKTLQMDPGQQTASIVDADVVFNPEFVRKTLWGLSTDSYPGLPDSLTFDIESIATHEIGHILGLVHSGVPTASMFFVLQPRKDGRTLEPDDIGWASYRYTTTSYATSFGSIEGNIHYGYDVSKPVAGALLLAVNNATNVSYHAYSDEAGHYLIPGLPPGQYKVLIRALNGRVFGYPMSAANVSAYLYAITSITDYPGEWYNQGDAAVEDPNLFTLVSVSAGTPPATANFVTNKDVTGPTVAGVFPADNATTIDVFTQVILSFSEAVSPTSINGTTLTVGSSSESVTGTFLLVNNNTTLTFTPAQPLRPTTTYTITASTGITDLKGNALTAFSSRFTTGQPDLTPPAVAQVVPENGAVEVYTTSPVIVRFSKSMNPATITSNNFKVTHSGGQVDGTIVVTEQNTIATLTPPALLSEGITYTVHVTTVVTDPIGNPLPVEFTSTFTTVSGAPTVAAIGPANNSTGISVTTPILVDFSKPIDISTVNPQTISLTVGGSPVSGTFEFLTENARVVFRPSAPLLFGTLYQINILAGATGIKDVSGRPLDQAGQSTFTTAVIQQTPIITSIDPPAAPPGTTVVIAGTGFDPDPTKNTVTFNGIIAGASSSSLTSATVVVPDGVSGGIVNVQLTSRGTPSGLYLFDVLIPLLNPQDNIIAGASTESQPKNTQVTPDGTFAYVTNFGANTVSVIGLASATPTVGQPIPVGKNPYSIAITPDGKWVYVTNYGSNSVSVIKTETNTVTNTIPVGMNPMGIAVTPDGSRIYVANSGSNAVSVIDGDLNSGAFNHIIAGASTSSPPKDVAISPDGTMAFVTGGNALLIIDINPASPSYNSIIGQASTSSETKGVAVTPDGTLAIVTTKDGGIWLISVYPKSPGFGQIIAGASTTSGGGQPAPSPDGTRVYVTNRAANSVSIYDIAYAPGVPPGTVSGIVTTGITLKLTNTIQVGTAPEGIAIDPRYQKIVVVNSGSSNVTIIGVSGVSDVAVQTLGALIGTIQSLIDKPSTSKQAANHLQKAQDALRTAADQISKGDVDHAYDRLREAIHELQLAASPTLVVSSVVTSISQVADVIAQDAIEAARVFAGTSQAKKNIADAEGEIQRARAYVNSGEPEKAMTSYKNAWDKAQLAIKLGQQAKGSNKSQSQNTEAEQTELSLGQNYPNPFNSTTQIVFDIPMTEAEGLFVELKVYNLLGQAVRTLVNEVKTPGRYIVSWNGKHDDGRSLASGMYIVNFRAGKYQQARKVVLVQ